MLSTGKNHKKDSSEDLKVHAVVLVLNRCSSQHQLNRPSQPLLGHAAKPKLCVRWGMFGVGTFQMISDGPHLSHADGNRSVASCTVLAEPR